MIHQNAREDTLTNLIKNKPKKIKKQNLSSSSNSNSSSVGLRGSSELMSSSVALPQQSQNSIHQPVKFSLLNRIELSSKFLENNSELVLNCVQLINFVEFYFNDNQLASSVCGATNETTQRALTPCFPCIVCLMKFSFDQTFHMHLERKSAVIRVYCVKCDSLKKFYNKCKLLYHVYSHKMTLFEPIYKSIQIESLPILTPDTNLTSTAAMRQGLNNNSGGNAMQMLSKERTIDIDLIFSNVFQAGSDLEANASNELANLNSFNNGFKVGFTFQKLIFFLQNRINQGQNKI